MKLNGKSRFIIVLAVCVPAVSATYRLEPFPSLEEILRALRSGQELQFYPTEEIQAYPSIEDIVRAHLHPDRPPVQDDIPINCHHLRRLTALSIRYQTFGSFAIFRGGNLDSLRMYNSEVQDFNSVAFLLGIRELHIRNCGIKDISPLARLRELTNLSLTDNHIKDISALSRCKELTWLDLRNNRIDNVSALRKLHKLVYVDLRDNPLEVDSHDRDILAIKVSNPGVHILLGKQSASKADLEQQLSSRAKISEFALCARFQYEDGLVFPLLPDLSAEISEALICLAKSDDKEYLADIASLLMKYAIELRHYYRPGPVWGRGEQPLLDAFLDGVGLKIGEEGIPALSVAKWICDNRNALVPSVVLDMQIEKNSDLLIELKRKGLF